jgi:hypothetical protein
MEKDITPGSSILDQIEALRNRFKRQVEEITTRRVVEDKENCELRKHLRQVELVSTSWS